MVGFVYGHYGAVGLGWLRAGLLSGWRHYYNTATFFTESAVVTELATYNDQGPLRVRVLSLKIITRIARTAELSFEHEARVLGQLKPRGLGHRNHSWHIWEWDWMVDGNNFYIVTDILGDSCVSMFAETWLRDFRATYSSLLQNQMLVSFARKFMEHTWMLEALRIFDGTLECLIVVHRQSVCYLDINMNNVVIDSKNNTHLARSAKSEIMIQGSVNLTARALPSTLSFAAPELRRNTTHQSFLGAPVDVWSAGVLLYRLLCTVYPGGPSIEDDVEWLGNLLGHLHPRNTHNGREETCFICRFDIGIPPELYRIFRGVFETDPRDRLTASQAAQLTKRFLVAHEFDVAFFKGIERRASAP